MNSVRSARCEVRGMPQDGRSVPLCDYRANHRAGTVLIIVSAVLTIWSMVYYLQKALPEIRARVR